MSKEKPHIAMIGTGAMGGALGTLLADAGEQVTMIDTDHDIVRCVSQSGFRLEGAAGERTLGGRRGLRRRDLPAQTERAQALHLRPVARVREEGGHALGDGIGEARVVPQPGVVVFRQDTYVVQPGDPLTQRADMRLRIGDGLILGVG